MHHDGDCGCDNCLSQSFAEGGEVSQFDTPLNPGDELLFQQWKAQYAPNDSGHDYDLRGAWKAGLLPGADGHWSDQFKKPNHPTFSDQSQYAGQGYPGSWEGDDYTPFQGYAGGGKVVQQAMRSVPSYEALIGQLKSRFSDFAKFFESAGAPAGELSQAEIDALRNSETIIRRPSLAEFLDRGFISNQMTAPNNRTKGYKDPEMRRKLEQSLFGYLPTDPDAMHPKYGYLSDPKNRGMSFDKKDPLSITYPDRGESQISSNFYGSAQQYGNIGLALKPSLKDRTTFLQGDSLSSFNGDRTSAVGPGGHINTMEYPLVGEHPYAHRPEYDVGEHTGWKRVPIEPLGPWSAEASMEGRNLRQAPSLILDPSELSADRRWGRTTQKKKSIDRSLEDPGSHYTEAQVHGDVLPEDISHIYHYATEPSSNVARQAQKLGSDYVHVPPPEELLPYLQPGLTMEDLKRINPKLYDEFQGWKVGRPDLSEPLAKRTKGLGWKEGGAVPVKNFAQGGLADALRYFGLDSLASAWEDSHDSDSSSHVAAAVEPGLGGRISYHDVPPASVAAKAAKTPGVMDAISGGLDLPFKTLGNMAEARGASPALSTAAYALPQLMGFDSLPAVGKAAKTVGRAAAEGAPGFMEKLMASNPTLNFALRPDQVVKPRGGNWMHYEIKNRDPDPAAGIPQTSKVSGLDTNLQSIKDNIPPIRQGQVGGDEAYGGNYPARSWVDKQLKKYLMTNWGTADDPLADMLVRGELPRYGNEDIEAYQAAMQRPLNRDKDPRDLFTKSTLHSLKLDKPTQPDGSVINDVVDKDSYLYKNKLKRDLDIAYTDTRTGDLKTPDWIKKLPQGADLHDLSLGRNSFHDLMQPNFDQLWDYFNTLRPEQINNMGVPDAFRNSKVYHDALAKKMTDDPIAAGGADLHKEYPDTGFKWLKLKSDEALNAEGKMMGHCVGSYCDQVKSGSSQIYSLRDKEGRSHVTIEANPPRGGTPNFSYDKMKNLMTPEQVARFEGTEDVRKHHYPIELGLLNEGEVNDIIKRATPPLNIRQIKGKQNKAPVADYIPYVQDFIKSGKWGDIGDIDHAGMFDAHMYPSYQLRTEWGDLIHNSLADQLGRAPKNHEMDSVSDEVVHQLRHGKQYYVAGDPEFEKRLQDEIARAVKDIKGYAQGGLVAKDIAMDPDALESLFLLHHE